jgi:hypothetical protein
MSQSEKGLGNSQTLCIDLDELEYETLQQSEGHATVIRFRVHNDAVFLGDTLVVLEGPEIRFHGMISSIEHGWAVASDRRGSLIPQ